MKVFTGFLVFVLFTHICKAQYYYKDLVVTSQTSEQWRAYKSNGIKGVRLSSFEADGQPAEGFLGEQEIASDYTLITTHTKAVGTPDTWLFVYYTPEGLPVKIQDTSDTYRSFSEYQFNAAGKLITLTNTSTETDNHLKEVEQHIWSYDEKGRPSSMLKIRGGVDTTFVRLVLDEKGNVAEEHASRNKLTLPTVYYYYDQDNRLTDIVRYNIKAQRLLPDYMFEYDGDKLSSMLVVPEGSGDYQKWIYAYNEKGLKVKETCFNKKKELQGRIEYQYISK